MQLLKTVLYCGRCIYWISATCILWIAADNFLSAPLGFKETQLPPIINFLAASLVVALCVVSLAKPRLRDALSATAEHSSLGKRNLAGQHALAKNGHVIEAARQICEAESIDCNQYGSPELSFGIFDKDDAGRAEWVAATRAAEVYKPILIDALRSAIGSELLSSLGRPDISIAAVSGHKAALACCRLEFNHADQGLFRRLSIPQQTGSSDEVYVDSDKRNVEVSHSGGFGVFDPGCGEQYLPGDLRVIAGVLWSDKCTSGFRAVKYQVNPDAQTFLSEMFDLDALPDRS